jgi:tetratricopeptide (TPR) repeat protein
MMNKGQIRAVVATILLMNACATVKLGDDFQIGRSELLRGNPDLALAHFQRVAAASPNYVNDSNLLGEGIWTYVGRAYYAKGNFSEAGEAFREALKQKNNDSMARLYHGLTLIRSSVITGEDRSFSLDNILYALKERVTSKRLSTLVKERGISFHLTAEAEKNMRRAGADNELIEMIRRVSLEKENAPQEKARKQGLEELERSLRTVDKWLQYIVGTPEGRFWDPEKRIRSQVKTTLAMLSSQNANQQELIDGAEWLGKALEEEADLAKRDQEEKSNRPRG